MAEEDASNTNSKNVPHVIKFAYADFTANEVKKIHTAKCKRCRAVIREKLGTTSAFVYDILQLLHIGVRVLSMNS